ncbi:MAG: hypothetical protein WCF06_09205 [Nitrososphaeraceae archaeon]
MLQKQEIVEIRWHNTFTNAGSVGCFLNTLRRLLSFLGKECLWQINVRFVKISDTRLPAKGVIE